jgi:hypothetical protein
MSPDGTRNQERLCWRGSTGICCTGLGSQWTKREKHDQESEGAYMNHNINQEKLKAIEEVMKDCLD